jgi:hypothetical protein
MFVSVDNTNPTVSINMSCMVENNEPDWSFRGMTVKTTLVVVYSAEVPRLCTTSSWHGWFASKPPRWCLGHSVVENEESRYGDSNRK